MPDVDRVMRELKEMEKRMAERLEAVNLELKDTRIQLFRSLFGDLQNQPHSPGLMGRVDRLEQRAIEEEAASGNRRNWFLALWSGLGALGAAEAWNWLTRKQ